MLETLVNIISTIFFTSLHVFLTASGEPPLFRASKKIILPDPSVRSVMIKYLEKTGEINFDKIFNQRLGYLLFKDFCLNIVQEQVDTIHHTSIYK